MHEGPWFAIDTGSSRNAFALAGVDQDRSGVYYPIVLREWIPSPGAPLDVRLREGPEAARIVRALGGRAWATDSYDITSVRHVGNEHGIQTIVETSDVDEQWRHTKAPLARGRVALGPVPRRLYTTADGEGRAYVEQEDLDALRSQLGSILRVPGQAGKWQIKIPEIGGLHGDLARAFARALWLARAGNVVVAPARSVDVSLLGGRSRTDVLPHATTKRLDSMEKLRLG